MRYETKVMCIDLRRIVKKFSLLIADMIAFINESMIQ